MTQNRPPRGRKPHLLKALIDLTEQVKDLGCQASALGYRLQALRSALDAARNPHTPRTNAAKARKAARHG
jgi:hypothetical protein